MPLLLLANLAIGIVVLLLLAVGLSVLAARRAWPRDERVRARLVATAAGYTGLFAVTVWQAIRGRSVVTVDAVTLGALFVVAAGTGVAAVAVARRAVTTRAARSQR